MVETLKGTNGKIIVYDDKLVISRKTFGGFANFGVVPDRTLYYNSIQGIDMSIISLKIRMFGDNGKQYKLNSFSQNRLQQKDENTIMFLSPSKRKTAKRIYAFINQKLNK